MAVKLKRKVGSCEISETIVRGRRIFTCKNLKRVPTAQEIIDSVQKIKYR